MAYDEWHKKCYYNRKEQGLCVWCGKVPALPGYTMCPSCLNYNAVRAKKNALKNRPPGFSSFLAKQRRVEMKAKGLCVKCGKNPARIKKNGQLGVYCESCNEIYDIGRWEGNGVKPGGGPKRSNADC
jgi:hypothetical protein